MFGQLHKKMNIKKKKYREVKVEFKLAILEVDLIQEVNLLKEVVKEM